MNKNKSTWKFSNDEKEKIVQLWKNGCSTMTISRMFGCNDEPIRELIIRRVPIDEYKRIVKKHMKRFEERKRIKKIRRPELTKDLAWWVGVVKGDGNVNSKNGFIRLGVREREFRDKWASVGRLLFGIEPKVRDFIKDKKPFYQAQFNSIKLVEYLKENFGFFGRYIWNIPNKVKSNKPDILFGFLRGLFDSEGSMKFYGRERGTVISLVSVRKECIFEIKTLLKKFNIKSRIKPYKRKDRKNTYYILYIGGFDNISKFAKNINFSISRKNNKLSSYLNYITFGVDEFDAN